MSVMRALKPCQYALIKNFLIATSLVVTLAVSQAAFAQQVVMDNYFCAEDISNVGSCTANEVSLSGVSNITVTDVADNPLTECVEGSQIKIATLTADLDANTGTRYDVTFWVGKVGNDPRNGSGTPPTPGLCVALGLPDNTGSPFIADFEGGADTDACLDLAQPDAPLNLQFGGNGALLTCSDTPTEAFPNGDGIADIQVLTTWQQNQNFACGFGDQTPPFDAADPVFSPGSPSKCDYVIIDLVPIVQAEMEFTKEVTDVDGAGPGGSVDEAGDVISYELTVTNNGGATLTGVDAGDPLFDSFDSSTDCTPAAPASLAGGASMVCTGTYTVPQSDIDDNGGGDGDIDNQAFGISNQIGTLNDVAAVPIIQAPAMTLVKSVTDVGGDGPAGVVDEDGDVISYSLLVTNTGNVTLTGVSADDPLFEGYDPTTDCSPAAPATLAPGGTMTCTGQYTATQADIDNNGGGDGDIDNTASADSTETGPPVTDTASVPISRASNYTIVKTVTDVDGEGPNGTVDQALDVISYQVVVTNTGNTTLTGVSVADPRFDSPPVCNPAAPASLAPADVMTCTGEYTATQADIDNNGGGDGDIDNTATASSNQLSNITDSADVPISQVPNFTIDKSVTSITTGGTAGFVNADGDVVNYSVVVTNTGNVTLTGVSVADPLFDAAPVCNPVAPATLAPAAVMTCTGQYTATQDDIDNDGGGDGDIDNTATASTDQVADKMDNAAAPIAGQPSYSIVKSVTDVDGAGPGGVVNAAGDVISYSVVVTNTGSVSLNNVAVADPLFDAAPVCNPVAPAVLAPAAVMTCTGTYTAVQQDLDNDGNPVPGSMEIANTATVSSDELPDDSDSATVPVVANGAYSIVKTVTDVDGAGAGGAVNEDGDVVTYSIVVTNNGNITLHNVGVADPLIAGLVCAPIALTGDMAPGDVTTCTGTYAATQDDIDSNGGGNGVIENTATLSSDELPDETDGANVPVVSSPAMTLVKASTTTIIDAADDVVPYTFVITNTGNTTLTNVSLSDNNVDAPPVCNPVAPATLAPAAVMNCTAQHTVTAQEFQNLNTLVNVATATSTQTPPEQDSVSIPIVRPPVNPPPVHTPVPADSRWAVALLILLMLGVGWRFAPVRQRLR